MIITTYNEGKNLGKTLRSLLSQSVQCNIIIVDSMSTDNTKDIVASFNTEKILFNQKQCSRGEGRNIGVNLTDSENILFTDGDAIPDEKWVEGMVRALDKFDLVAGKTITEGPKRYSRFKRVELSYGGFEITAPSMNLGLKRKVFLAVHGFDNRMITAEDIDLNLRVLLGGYRGGYCEHCIVYHNSRNTLISFLKQAFWNGYGRAQLKNKNKDIFDKLQKGSIYKGEIGIIWFLRNVWAVMGYLWFLLSGKKKFNRVLVSQ